MGVILIELDGLIEFRNRFDITSLIGKCKAKAIIFFVAGTNVDSLLAKDLYQNLKSHPQITQITQTTKSNGQAVQSSIFRLSLPRISKTQACTLNCLSEARLWTLDIGHWTFDYFFYGPKRPRYSPETMNALTISAR